MARYPTTGRVEWERIVAEPQKECIDGVVHGVYGMNGVQASQRQPGHWTFGLMFAQLCAGWQPEDECCASSRAAKYALNLKFHITLCITCITCHAL